MPGPGAPDPLLDPPSWAPSWLPTVDDVRGFRVLRWVVYAVLFAGLASCMSRGADSPADPVLGPTSTATASTAPDGTDATSAPVSLPTEPVDVDELAGVFGTAMARLISASGEALELCVLQADTAQERAQGLMQVTDLGSYDGMVFANEAPKEGPFYMYRTLLPLTVAWWDQTGAFVSAADMVPCDAEDPSACQRYPPAGPYLLALEVPQGSPLAAQFAPGASLRLTGQACPATS